MRIAKILSQPSLDQEIILAHILKCERIDLYKEPQKIITLRQNHCFQKLLKKYSKGYPMAYLTGHREFMSLDFKVTPAVLIPRSETELLVETAIKYIGSLTHNTKRKTQDIFTVMDLGTGSGNIAISIAKHSPVKNICIIASDISHLALRIARLNARCHQVGKYIRFCYGNIFNSKIPLPKMDIIISNPPYVNKNDKSKWKNTIRYEPDKALWAKENGLFYVKRIIAQAPGNLKPGGHLLIEIGYDQSNSLLKIIKSGNCFENIKILKDYNRIPRVLCATSKLQR